MGDVGALPYSMVVDSRFIPVGKYKFNEAEAKLWRAFIDYADTEALTVRVRAQFGKFISVYEVTLVRQEGIFETESLAYRDYIAGGVKPGVAGKSMNLYLEKVVPATGDVEFTGFNLDIQEIQREHGDEWICEGVNAITDKTFTVDANAVTEVNAYE
jgi:hypothetical protein